MISDNNTKKSKLSICNPEYDQTKNHCHLFRTSTEVQPWDRWTDKIWIWKLAVTHKKTGISFFPRTLRTHE